MVAIVSIFMDAHKGTPYDAPLLNGGGGPVASELHCQ